MPKKKSHGKMRQSQLISIFGPGALLDLPRHSVIVGGLEGWERGNEINEPRLIQKLQGHPSGSTRRPRLKRPTRGTARVFGSGSSRSGSSLARSSW